MRLFFTLGGDRSFLQGTLTVFVDHESLTPVLSYNMAVCTLKLEDAKLILTRREKLYKHKVSGHAHASAAYGAMRTPTRTPGAFHPRNRSANQGPLVGN